MTMDNVDGKRVRGRSRINSHTVLGALTLCAFVLILFSSDVAIEYMKKGLRLCATTVIPSLFPFMIISELIVSSGVGVRLSRCLSGPMRLLFGVGEAGAAAFFLGIVCGFPIGARAAVSMYDKGVISKRELERILTFCNNPGSAFVISAVGVSLLGNKWLGVLLYACVILSSVIVGVVGKLFWRTSDACAARARQTGRLDAVKAVTDAIQSSAVSMLYVSAYVVFFSALVGCVGVLLSRLSPRGEVFAIIFGFFELSSGVSAAVGATGIQTAALLCALFLGWSGLSVHFQVMSVCSGRGLSFAPYLISKAAQGVICAVLAWCAIRFVCPHLTESAGAGFLPSAEAEWGFGKAVIIALFLASLTVSGIAFLRKKKVFKNKSENFEKRY